MKFKNNGRISPSAALKFLLEIIFALFVFALLLKQLSSFDCRQQDLDFLCEIGLDRVLLVVIVLHQLLILDEFLGIRLQFPKFDCQSLKMID